MIYKKRVSTGRWLRKGEDIKAGDTLTICNEGQQIDGQFGSQDIFLMRTKDGKEGNVAVNSTSINTLIDGYGEDSLKWIGKNVKVEVIKQNVQGKIISVYYFLHPDAMLDEETGQFVLPAQKKNDENDFSDIPF